MIQKTNPKVCLDGLLYGEIPLRMSVFILIAPIVDVVITIETKAFFNKKRGLHGPFELW